MCHNFFYSNIELEQTCSIAVRLSFNKMRVEREN